MPARQINRFTRTYEEFDPDGTGGGPPTWVLASPGGGVGVGAIVNGTSGVLAASVGTVAVPIGSALAINSAGELILADANRYDTSVCVGLALTSATGGNVCSYSIDGQLSLADWTAVAGTALLQPGKRYFLDPAAPGRLTVHCPARRGVYAAPVGTAISQTLLDIEINLPIRQ